MRGSLTIQDARGGGVGGLAFGGVSGSPADNAALAEALNARVGKAGDVMSGGLTVGAAGAAGAPGLAVTGAPFSGGTRVSTKPLALLEPAGTLSDDWPVAGTMLGINAPAGGTLLMALRVDGAQRVDVLPDGSFYKAGYYGFSQAGALAYAGLSQLPGGRVPVALSGSGVAIISAAMAGGAGYVQMRGDTVLGWAPDGTVDQSNGNDVALVRLGAGRLGLSNGAVAQAFHVDRMRSSGTDHESAELGWTGDAAHLWTTKGSGGGVARELHLGHDGVANMKLGANGGIDFSGLSLTTESVVGNRSFTMKIGGTTVRVPCVV